MAKVAVLCEFSGRVRDAFIRRGHEAVSCDLLPSASDLGPHIRGDCLDHDWGGYDLVICHPPCTHLCSSGAAWWKDRRGEQERALEFVEALLSLDVNSIALENPVGLISTRIRKPDQIIHPWMFGQSANKATCLWLKNLPKLIPTKLVDKEAGGVRWYDKAHYKGGNRSRVRSLTFFGVAEAMAEQWGGYLNSIKEAVS